NTLVRKFLAEQGRFPRITGENSVGILKQAMRLEKKAEELAPFPTAFERRIETLLDRFGQIQYATVNGQNEWNLPLFGNGSANGADAAQCVRVNERDILFMPKRRNEVEGHEVSADSNHLPPPYFGEPQNGHKSVETLHLMARSHQRIFFD